LNYLDSTRSTLPSWRRVRRNQRTFRKWAHHAPENLLHGYHLVEARRCEIDGKHNQAIDHYEKAIELSRKHGFLKEHALANEMAGRFYLKSGKPDLGLFYLRRARTTYVRWGAMAKVDSLDQEFANLREEDYFRTAPESNDVRSTLAPAAGNYQGYGNFLDLGTVIKASQVLSGEIILENLLERLMQVALENAGAHNASLVLNRDDQLVREITTRTVGTTTEHHLDSTPIEEVEEIPTSVIQYVARTREDLVLNDALNEDIFTQDDYIISEKPKSILCIPILSQSHLTGVLYLENLQSTHAFSQDRVAILNLLASQSAIAIENAKLYRQLNDSR
ncbi:MAG: GAF domain-containing protein, partial [Pseudomonadales bacterium]|nr:GAF domain-containing protein [Pseudomonadales bacterium]